MDGHAHAQLRHLLGVRTALWNALIPKRAIQVEPGPHYTRYLHPTKGWRRVSNRRLGIA